MTTVGIKLTEGRWVAWDLHVRLLEEKGLDALQEWADRNGISMVKERFYRRV